MKHNKPNPHTLQVDLPPETPKQFSGNENPLGEDRLLALLDLCDEIGVDNRRPLSPLFGKVRDSGPTDQIFDHQVIGNFLHNGCQIKATAIFFVEFEIVKSPEIPAVTKNCAVCGQPLSFNLNHRYAKIHRDCLLSSKHLTAINNIKNRVCVHTIRGIKQSFPCTVCRYHAKKNQIKIDFILNNKVTT